MSAATCRGTSGRPWTRSATAPAATCSSPATPCTTGRAWGPARTRRRRGGRPPARHTEELDDDTYGPAKVACEDDVLARYGSRATIVRPGKVAGPHDNQSGLTYWVRRAARGGRVALPG